LQLTEVVKLNTKHAFRGDLHSSTCLSHVLLAILNKSGHCVCKKYLKFSLVDIITKRGKMWTWPVTFLFCTGWWFRFTTRPIYVHGSKSQHAQIGGWVFFKADVDAAVKRNVPLSKIEDP